MQTKSAEKKAAELEPDGGGSSQGFSGALVIVLLIQDFSEGR